MKVSMKLREGAVVRRKAGEGMEAGAEVVVKQRGKGCTLAGEMRVVDVRC